MVRAGAHLSKDNPTRKHIIKLVRSRICPGSIRNVYCCNDGKESTKVDPEPENVAPISDSWDGSGDYCDDEDY